MSKVRLTALDDRVITKRTGVISEVGELTTFTINETTHEISHTIMWQDGNIGDSPGIHIFVCDTKKIDDKTVEFVDGKGRPFKIEYL